MRGSNGETRVRPGSTAWRQPQQYLENPSRFPRTNIASVFKNYFCKFVFVDFLAALGLRCFESAFSSCSEWVLLCSRGAGTSHGGEAFSGCRERAVEQADSGVVHRLVGPWPVRLSCSRD